MKKLEVRLSNFPSGDLVVGTLVTQDRSLFFEYDSRFLTNPLMPILLVFSLTWLVNQQKLEANLLVYQRDRLEALSSALA